MALVLRLAEISRYSYRPVTVVSAHPRSTTNAERSPAATAAIAGLGRRVILGNRQRLKRVDKIEDNNGCGMIDGMTSTNRDVPASVSRYLVSVEVENL